MRTHATTTLGLVAAFATAANAHSVFTTLFVNGADQGDGTCVRMPKDGSTATNPIASITGNDMACGRDGQNAVKYTCPVPGGSKLAFEWRLYPDYSQPGSIDKSHKGPCAVYLKQVADMNSAAAAGPGWFKIWHEGYDETTKQWCTEKLMANNGLLSVQLPSGLPGGYYLVRPELLALHEADKGDPQFYTGCAQILVDGSAGTLDVPAKNQCSIPGHVQPGEKSVSFNIYGQPMALPYPIPGPEPYVPTGAAGGGGGGKQAPGAEPPKTGGAGSGAPPQDCLLKVANWCGTEVQSYSDAGGCYKASDDCYKQLSVCYSSAPPTGADGCKEWEQKCKGIQDSCSSGSPSGPPSKGAKLQNADKPLPGAIPPVPNPQAAASGSASSQPSSSPPSSPAPSSPFPSSAPAQASLPAPAVKDDSASSGGQSQGSDDQVTTAPTPASTPAPVASTAPTSSPAGAGAGSDDSESGSGSSSGGSSDDSKLQVSADGKCGGRAGNQTCKGSKFGECCSKRGRCGSSRFHCAASSSGARGCQEKYGSCKGADGNQNGKAGETQGLGSSFQQHKTGSGGSFLDAMRGASGQGHW
ncbi:hypothetical protein RB598_000594 [Gaeumannomyces tritici]